MSRRSSPWRPRGMASVRVELKTGADIGEVMDEVKSAVGRIQSFPGVAERPQFREMDNRTSMIRLIVFGDIPERSLKELAYEIEDELGSLPNVSNVVTTGARNYEISIEVPHRSWVSSGSPGSSSTIRLS